MVKVKLLNCGRYPELDFMRFPVIVKGDSFRDSKSLIRVHLSQFGLNCKNERNYYVFTIGDECEVIDE